MTIAYKIGALLPMLASTMTVDEIARLTSMLRTLAIVAFAIGALALIGSIVIWIKLDIKNVIGFLSGKNAAKAIEALLTGKQAYKGKSKGVRPSEPTGRPSAGANVGYDPGLTTPLQDADRTELLDKSRRGAPASAAGSGEETELLGSRRGSGDETELLGSRRGSGDETELLGSRRGGGDETELLDGAARPQQPMRSPMEERTVRMNAPMPDDYGDERTVLLANDSKPMTGAAQPAPSPAPRAPRQFKCDDTQILTSVWDEEIDIDL